MDQLSVANAHMLEPTLVLAILLACAVARRRLKEESVSCFDSESEATQMVFCRDYFFIFCALFRFFFGSRLSWLLHLNFVASLQQRSRTPLNFPRSEKTCFA